MLLLGFVSPINRSVVMLGFVLPKSRDGAKLVDLIDLGSFCELEMSCSGSYCQTDCDPSMGSFGQSHPPAPSGFATHHAPKQPLMFLVCSIT
jgi:hypothetical protein